MKLKTKKDYKQHLNSLYSYWEIMELTEHLWAGDNKTEEQKGAYVMAYAGRYGQCLEKYDPEAFETGYKQWSDDKKLY